MSDGANGSPAAPSRNDELDRLHRDLVALVSKFELAVDDATTAAQVKALTEQIAAANARVTSVGRELFARRTDGIAAATAAVTTAMSRVEAALADLARLDAFVSNVTGMLRLVDHAVETARMAV